MEIKNNSYDENTKIKILAKYLVTKGVSTALRLQKLLFMLRFEEVVNGELNNSYFAPNNNFQARINGPVNTEVYYYLRPMFIEIDEKDHYLLSKEQVQKIEKEFIFLYFTFKFEKMCYWSKY